MIALTLKRENVFKVRGLSSQEMLFNEAFDEIRTVDWLECFLSWLPGKQWNLSERNI